MAVRTLRLKPVTVTPKILAQLEARGLLRTLRPTRKLLATRSRTGTVETFSAARPGSGSHLLLGVGKRSTDIRLSYHDHAEELILVKPAGVVYKPLYLVVGLQPAEALARRIRGKKLAAADFITLKLVYNKGDVSIFTVLAGTVHWEATVPGPGQHPVFFVTEPSSTTMRYLRTRHYRLALDHHGK